MLVEDKLTLTVTKLNALLILTEKSEVLLLCKALSLLGQKNGSVFILNTFENLTSS